MGTSFVSASRARNNTSFAVTGRTMFAELHPTVHVYAGHIRPNVGLYEEPEWVAQFPDFQKQQRAPMAERVRRQLRPPE